MVDVDYVKVYTVNGSAAGSSSSLPDWLTRKRATNGKSKRQRKEHVEGTIELIQGFEFSEASNKVKTTPDGHHVIATGTYKPQIKVWDLDQLTQKFERHTDAENVDFVCLSEDWTKSIHLQNDRTVELHTQGGFHYRTRIPRFGRALAYHFPSCDALIAASGNEVYRLNLDQGRFMNPLTLTGESDEILGVNAIDINAAHQLFGFALEGSSGVQFWDPRSRTSVGSLKPPWSKLASFSTLEAGDWAVTAIASRPDGLSYAVGTSTGHTLLYDIRAALPFATKDQGYGLPIKKLTWLAGGSRMAGDGLVLSADKKVVKIWDRNEPASNFASITPAQDLNDIHHVPGSGLLLAANEGIQMGAYFIPQLGPAPRWASFLENVTEEMEDQVGKTAYDDYKFVERAELQKLGLDHLIGTPTLKPYMHGYFVALKLYDAARLIANPFVYEEHREKLLQAKMDKLAETRIRTRKNQQPSVKVNKALAEKIQRDEERDQERAKRKAARKARAEGGGGKEDEEEDDTATAADPVTQADSQPSLLTDSRFSRLFEDPEYTVDENSREFALLNPSTVAKRQTATHDDDDDSDDDSALGSANEDDDDSADSSDEGDLNQYDPRKRPEHRLRAASRVKMVPLSANSEHRPGGGMGPAAASGSRAMATFGQNRKNSARASGGQRLQQSDRPMEVRWTPSAPPSSDSQKQPRPAKRAETFGAGLDYGTPQDERQISENDRRGRTERRKGVRSGSKNAFRKR